MISARRPCSRVPRRGACAEMCTCGGPCGRTAAALEEAAIERGRARRTARKAALPAAKAGSRTPTHGRSARRSAAPEAPATRKVATTTPAAVEATASAATMTATTLGESGFRHTSKCNKCKGYKQHFEKGGFSHFDYLHRMTEGWLGGRAFIPP